MTRGPPRCKELGAEQPTERTNDRRETALNTNSNVISSEIADAEKAVRDASDALVSAKARLRELRGSVAKAKAAPRECGCGCGNLTSGGTFLPGHDARLKSRVQTLVREARTHEEGLAALALLADYPALLASTGEHEIGRDRKERERKQADKDRRESEAQARRDDAAAQRKQAEDLRNRSRAETNKAADDAIEQKKRAIADAKANGMPANVAK